VNHQDKSELTWVSGRFTSIHLDLGQIRFLAFEVDGLPLSCDLDEEILFAFVFLSTICCFESFSHLSILYS
jgi:hypothetical protein